MRLKVLACGVFEPELRVLASRSPHEIDATVLDAGLHERPRELRAQAQAAIDAAEGYDAVVLLYGLCGRGTAGLVARDVPVVIPRVHDCLTLFLGSREEYRRQFSRHPGTFYITAGWYEKKMAMQGGAMGDSGRAEGAAMQEETAGRVRSARRPMEDDPRYREWAAKYGEDNARAIVEFYDSWRRNYTRAVFLDTGLGDRGTYAAYARDMAAEFGWIYEALEGHTELLEALLNGQWDRPDILVLRPGERSVGTGDDRVLGALQRGDGARAARPVGAMDDSRGATVSARTREGEGFAPGTLGLGLDSGGTFTDCVLLDLGTGEVVAKAKAQTTHFDLLVGIEEALDRLAIGDPGRIRMVALSTTLATNAIAEGKGGLIGAVLMTVDGRRVEQIRWQPQRVLSAGMDIGGRERRPLDRAEVARVVGELLEAGVEAFAVSGYGSVRNPVHELAVREVIRDLCDLPVVCGHELSTRLNFVNRANTAILNARLMPLIRSLIDAAGEVLRRHGVTAPLMIVKGDGSLISREVALERPVETVLSGPAASVAGARYLSRRAGAMAEESDALIMDMGGTTTDTAAVEEGMVRISEEGARVNGWQTSVAAAEIQTAGLGGDSHVRFTADRVLQVGPRRVIPLCYLAHAYPACAEELLLLDAERVVERASAAPLDFLVLGRVAPGAGFGEREKAGGGAGTVGSDDERRILDALAGGPLSCEKLSTRLGLMSPTLLRTERLESLGYVQRAGLTPTDVLHARGSFTAWDVRAARRALEVFAALYGEPAEVMGERILGEVVRRLCLEALRHELGDGVAEERDGKLGAELIEAALAGRDLGPVALRLGYTRPIVAIGAPVEAFFPERGDGERRLSVAARLGASVVVPPHAEVANAVGAVVSEVVVREQAVVRRGEVANFVLHWREGRREYENLGAAVEEGSRVVGRLASGTAVSAGAAGVRVRVRVDERRGYLATGEQELIEVRIEATAAGRPAALV